jgi:hypothetical protein
MEASMGGPRVFRMAQNAVISFFGGHSPAHYANPPAGLATVARSCLPRNVSSDPLVQRNENSLPLRLLSGTNFSACCHVLDRGQAVLVSWTLSFMVRLHRGFPSHRYKVSTRIEMCIVSTPKRAPVTAFACPGVLSMRK